MIPAVLAATVLVVLSVLSAAPASASWLNWYCVGSSGGTFDGNYDSTYGISSIRNSPCGTVSVRVHYYAYVGAPTPIWSNWASSTPTYSIATVNAANVIGSQHKSSLSSTIHPMGVQ